MICRRFIESDLAKVENRDGNWRLDPEIGMRIACQSWSWTFEDDDGPFCLAGCYQHWPGVGVAWMVANARLAGPARGVFVTKNLRRLLAQYCADNDVLRLQTTVDSRNKGYDRWIELLGFKLEFIQPLAAPGNAGDLMNYVYWRNGHEQG